MARAMGICTSTNGKDGYGYVSSSFALADGNPTQPNVRQRTVLTSFGNAANNPRQGTAMAAISSGTAYSPSTAPGFSASYGAGTPAVSAPPDYLAANGGILQTRPGCPTTQTTARDSVKYSLTLRAPTNAEGFSFQFRFFSQEYPTYVCTQYNDFFIVLLKRYSRFLLHSIDFQQS